MSSFDDWRAKNDANYAERFKFEPDYTQNELYFMTTAYYAGMSRAAEISEESIDWPTEAIRKEIEDG